MSPQRSSNLIVRNDSSRADHARGIPEWVTIPEAALLTGVPITHLERLVEEGSLFGSPLQAGRQWKGPLVVSTRELSCTGLLVPDSSLPSHGAIPRPVTSLEEARSSRKAAVGWVSLRRLQVALGLLWLLDGLLQLQPFMFSKAFISQVILASVDGQPSIVARPVMWAAHLMVPHIALWNALFALVQIAIGVGLLWKRTVKLALLLSFGWALSVWWFGEGLGGLATGTASMLTGAPGAVILYAVVGLVVWPRAERRSTRAAAGLLGERGLRVAWCALWVGAALYSVLPAQRAPGAISDLLSSNAGDASGVLASIQRWLAHGAAGRGLAISFALALLEAAIGLGVFLGSRARLFLFLGIGVSLAFWAVGQSFGELFSGTSTDPNAAPLYVLLALALIPTATVARVSV